LEEVTQQREIMTRMGEIEQALSMQIQALREDGEKMRASMLSSQASKAERTQKEIYELEQEFRVDAVKMGMGDARMKSMLTNASVDDDGALGRIAQLRAEFNDGECTALLTTGGTGAASPNRKETPCHYAFIALQAPPVLNGFGCAHQDSMRASVQQRLEDEEASLEEQKRRPWYVSGGGDLLSDEMKLHRAHCLVWCGTGLGWESNAMHSSERFLKAVRESSVASAAVVCLQYGARRAADQLRACGLALVVYIAMGIEQMDADFVVDVVLCILEELSSEGKSPYHHCSPIKCDGERRAAYAKLLEDSVRDKVEQL
jgi:hypothetical protein